MDIVPGTLKRNLALITLAVSVITLSLGLSPVSAIFPFDDFMTPITNDPESQSPEDPFKSKLPGEHGLPEEHGESPDDDVE
ncbi:MAG TPA: hypothetical protein VNA18_07175 [Nitrososphaeraceae archaeon]|nr:hypothetical protein [Nitrososphaeraceae archaeon]